MVRLICITILLARFAPSYAIHIGQKAFSKSKSDQGNDGDDKEDPHHHHEAKGSPTQAPSGVEAADPTTQKSGPTKVPDLYNPLVATNPEEAKNLYDNLAKPIAKILIDLAANSPQAKAAGFKPEQLAPYLGDKAVQSAVREGSERVAEGRPSAEEQEIGEDGLSTKYNEPDFSKMSPEEAALHERDHRQEHLPSKDFKECPDLEPSCVQEQNAKEQVLFDQMAKDQQVRGDAAAASAVEHQKKLDAEAAAGKAPKWSQSAWWKKWQKYWATGGVASDDDDEDTGEAAPTDAEVGADDLGVKAGESPKVDPKKDPKKVAKKVWGKKSH